MLKVHEGLSKAYDEAGGKAALQRAVKLKWLKESFQARSRERQYEEGFEEAEDSRSNCMYKILTNNNIYIYIYLNK